MVTQLWFAALVTLLAAQRLVELSLSRRNEARMRALGGQEHAPGHFRFMAALHSSWFVAMLVEVFVLRAELIPWVSLAAFCVTLLGQTLRYAAIRALGFRWSVRIVTVPNHAAVRRGIYRYLRHPNYVGVVLELLAVPLIHGAWRTALVWTGLNALVLAVRIRAEERALLQHDDYARLDSVPRFVPELRRPGA